MLNLDAHSIVSQGQCQDSKCTPRGSLSRALTGATRMAGWLSEASPLMFVVLRMLYMCVGVWCIGMCAQHVIQLAKAKGIKTVNVIRDR